MDRKLTVKEKVFLLELRELISNYSVIMYSENDRCASMWTIPVRMIRWSRLRYRMT